MRRQLPLRLRATGRIGGLGTSGVGHRIVKVRIEVKVEVKAEVKAEVRVEVKVEERVGEKVEERGEERVGERNARRGRRRIEMVVGATETGTEAIVSGEMDEKAGKTRRGGGAANAVTRDERGVRGRGFAKPPTNPTATPSDDADGVSIITNAFTHRAELHLFSQLPTRAIIMHSDGVFF